MKTVGKNGAADVLFVAPEKYHDSFNVALKRAEDSAAPFREAGLLMKSGRYDDALKALDESLVKSTRSIERSMVYDRMQQIYQKTGNLEKELEAIELWFKEAGLKGNNPEFKNRAEEIRKILNQKQTAVSPSS